MILVENSRFHPTEWLKTHTKSEKKIDEVSFEKINAM